MLAIPNHQGKKSCLTNLIAFCDETTGFVDKGRAVNVLYFDFGKALDTVSHNILVPSLGRYGLDGWKPLIGLSGLEGSA